MVATIHILGIWVDTRFNVFEDIEKKTKKTNWEDKCSTLGCCMGYNRKNDETSPKNEDIARFHCPLKKDELLEKWTLFFTK